MSDRYFLSIKMTLTGRVEIRDLSRYNINCHGGELFLAWISVKVVVCVIQEWMFLSLRRRGHVPEHTKNKNTLIAFIPFGRRVQ